MQPQELLRSAAEIIRAGWCHGAGVHARDHNGNPVPLFRGDNTGADKARVNPDAVSFSIYGALCAGMAKAGTAVASQGLMWDTLYRLAQKQMGGRAHAPGGTGYVHPIIGFNEREGQTAENIAAYLEDCAGAIERGEIPEPITIPIEPAKLESVS